MHFTPRLEAVSRDGLVGCAASLLAVEELRQERIDAHERPRKLTTNVAVSIHDVNRRGRSHQPGVGVDCIRIEETRVGHMEFIDKCSAAIHGVTQVDADEVDSLRREFSEQCVQLRLL